MVQTLRTTRAVLRTHGSKVQHRNRLCTSSESSGAKSCAAHGACKLLVSRQKLPRSAEGVSLGEPSQRARDSSGVILQIGARVGRRETACARRRETAAPNAGGPPPRRRGGARAPDATRGVEDEKQLHVHPVVDLLVVLRLLPRRDSGNVVAPIRMARRRVVVARPLRRFIC